MAAVACGIGIRSRRVAPDPGGVLIRQEGTKCRTLVFGFVSSVVQGGRPCDGMRGERRDELADTERNVRGGAVAWRLADGRRGAGGAATVARQGPADRRLVAVSYWCLVLSALPPVDASGRGGRARRRPRRDRDVDHARRQPRLVLEATLGQPRCWRTPPTRSARSSWLWRFQHNTLHHGNTNVVGFDADIALAPFARLAPSQPWHRWYRAQHIYIWPLYGFLALKNLLVSDVVALDHGAARPAADPPARTTPGRRPDRRRQDGPPRMGGGDPAAVQPVVGRARVLPGLLVARRVPARDHVPTGPLRRHHRRCTTRARPGEATTSPPTNSPPPPTSPPRYRSSAVSSGGWSAASITRSNTTSRPAPAHHLSARRRTVPPGLPRPRHRLPPAPERVVRPLRSHTRWLRAMSDPHPNVDDPERRLGNCGSVRSCRTEPRAHSGSSVCRV